MNRRNVLKGMGVIALYSSFPLILSEFVSSCNTKEKKLRAGFFSDDEFQLTEQLADAMMPKTLLPGAIDTQVPYFLDLVIMNCMSADDRKLIKNGLNQLNDQEHFSSLSNEERLNVIKKIDDAAFKDDADKAWFRIVKKLALIGHFTSQEGMTKGLNYVKVPSSYEACVPYKKGDKGLAKTFLLYW
jgi:glucoside 3-dehydrogenase (cytochrome c) hitch-hiker subunit